MKKKHAVRTLCAILAVGVMITLTSARAHAVSDGEEKQRTEWISQSELTAYADSYQTGNEPDQVTDGSTSTIWHTSWSNREELPQSITLERKDGLAMEGVYQLRYTPRTDKDWNGTILQYRISISEDGETFTDVAAGIWEATRDEKTATFDARDGIKAIRLTGITTKGNTESDDSKYVSAAEINLVCNPSFQRDSRELKDLVSRGQQLAAAAEEGELTILRGLLTEAQTALQDSLAVQERYEELTEGLREILDKKFSFTGYAGSRMYDTAGERIQAHGGQIVKWGDVWYWYGEDRTDGFRSRGVHLYTSEDLYNWEDQGLVMKTMKSIGEMDTDPYLRHCMENWMRSRNRKSSVISIITPLWWNVRRYFIMRKPENMSCGFMPTARKRERKGAMRRPWQEWQLQTAHRDRSVCWEPAGSTVQRTTVEPVKEWQEI